MSQPPTPDPAKRFNRNNFSDAIGAGVAITMATIFGQWLIFGLGFESAFNIAAISLFAAFVGPLVFNLLAGKPVRYTVTRVSGAFSGALVCSAMILLVASFGVLPRLEAISAAPTFVTQDFSGIAHGSSVVSYSELERIGKEQDALDSLSESLQSSERWLADARISHAVRADVSAGLAQAGKGLNGHLLPTNVRQRFRAIKLTICSAGTVSADGRDCTATRVQLLLVRGVLAHQYPKWFFVFGKLAPEVIEDPTGIVQ